MLGKSSPRSGREVAGNGGPDVEVPEVAADGITSVKFSPVAEHLCATSWDGSLRLWECISRDAHLAPSGLHCAPKSSQHNDAPVLCAAFGHDGARVFCGATDGEVKVWDLASSQFQRLGRHDHGVKDCAFVAGRGLVVTGSWDKRLCYWDCRTTSPVLTHVLPDRLNSMDLKGHLLVVATAERQLHIFDVRNPATAKSTSQSPLRWQTRCVSCFHDERGYFVGSVEGRCAVEWLEPTGEEKSFTFKCHRHAERGAPMEIYAVNAIAVHPSYGTFATCGSDGIANFWDKTRKRRLKSTNRCDDSISTAAFSRDGSLFAYAVSYDWRFGVEGYNPETMRSRILLHRVKEDEVRPCQLPTIISGTLR